MMSCSVVLGTSCRICLKESLESFYEMNNQSYFSLNDQSLCEIFNFCTHFKVQIIDDDKFPQRICELCVQDLQKTYEFLQRVLASNKRLIEIKKSFNENKEDIFEDNEGNDDDKDPLENATDGEDAFNIRNKFEITEQNYEDKYSRISFGNTDNNVKNPPHDNNMPSHLSDSDDKSYDGDFLKSIESQIFPQGRLKCKICYKTYFTNVGLQAHMDIHLPKPKAVFKTSLTVEKSYVKKQKTVNGVSSDDKNADDQNIKFNKGGSKTKQQKPKKVFPCEVCGKQMISASKLRYHMVMHTGEKDYLCTMCPNAYSTIYALKHHMRAHTGERPYECKFCGDRFLRPTTLKSHMRRHTGERPYGCDVCGKRFIQHSSMATHMKLNHMDKTISCSYCDKKYARQTDLNTHLLSHSGDKPFACQTCPSRFTRQSNLNKHINQHHTNPNLGDKKCKMKTISDEYDAQQFENTDNKNLSNGWEFDRPSCSSNLK